MSAYIILDVEIRDQDLYREYVEATRRPGVGSESRGRALVRGGEIESLEGDWRPQRLLVLEFPDAEAARDWYFSPAYQEAKKIRDRAADSRAVLVHGT